MPFRRLPWAEGLGTAPAQDLRKSCPGPRNRIQVIALKAVQTN